MATENFYKDSSVNRSPYSSIAAIYDRMMHHVEYGLWVGLISDIVTNYSNNRQPSVYEIGAGTGVLGQMLVERGFDYRGSDFSMSMCLEAKKRGLCFACMDGKRIALKKQFDFVLFLYDGINYLSGTQDYKSLFSGVHHCLNPGGLFFFDITTEANSIRHFLDFLDFEDYEDSFYVRHSYYDKSTQIQYNDFTIFKRFSGNAGEGLFEKRIERHTQKVYSVKEITGMIPNRLFSVEGIWEDFSFQPHTPRSNRVHFLLRRKETT